MTKIENDGRTLDRGVTQPRTLRNIRADVRSNPLIRRRNFTPEGSDRIRRGPWTQNLSSQDIGLPKKRFFENNLSHARADLLRKGSYITGEESFLIPISHK